MLTLDLCARFRNKAFILAMVSAVVLLIQQMGFTFIPANYTTIVNTFLTILGMLGIVVDTSTTGVSDYVAPVVETQSVIEPVTSTEVASDVIDAATLQAENEQLKAQLAQVKTLITNTENIPTI